MGRCTTTGIVALVFILVFLSLAACSDDTGNGPPVDGQVGDLAAGDTFSSVDGALVDGRGPDGPVADLEREPDARLPTVWPLLRIFDGLPGAKITVCMNNQPYGSSLDRVAISGSKIVFGYSEVKKLGQVTMHIQPYTGQGCNVPTPSSSKLKVMLREGEVYTLVAKNLTLFPFKKLTDDTVSPAAGKARVRVYSGLEGKYDLCVGRSPLAAGLSKYGVSSYVETPTGAVTIELRSVATSGSCQGSVWRKVALTLDPKTYTLFLTPPGADKTKPPRGALCVDVDAGKNAMPSTCQEKALDTP